MCQSPCSCWCSRCGWTGCQTFSCRLPFPWKAGPRNFLGSYTIPWTWEKLWMLHPCKCLRPDWMGLWASCSSGRCPSHGTEVGMRWSLMSFTAQTIQCFHDTVILWLWSMLLQCGCLRVSWTLYMLILFKVMNDKVHRILKWKMLRSIREKAGFYFS